MFWSLLFENVFWSFYACSCTAIMKRFYTEIFSFNPLPTTIILPTQITTQQSQMDLNSIERIQEYSALQPEKYHKRRNDGGSGGEGYDGGDEDDADGNEEEDTADSMDAMDKSTSGLTSTTKFGARKYQPVKSSSGGSSGGSEGIELSVTNPVYNNNNNNSSNSNNSDANTSNAKWPNEGRVEFRNISLRYNSSATPVLRWVNVT